MYQTPISIGGLDMLFQKVSLQIPWVSRRVQVDFAALNLDLLIEDDGDPVGPEKQVGTLPQDHRLRRRNGRRARVRIVRGARVLGRTLIIGVRKAADVAQTGTRITWPFPDAIRAEDSVIVRVIKPVCRKTGAVRGVDPGAEKQVEVIGRSKLGQDHRPEIGGKKRELHADLLCRARDFLGCQDAARFVTSYEDLGSQRY